MSNFNIVKSLLSQQYWMPVFEPLTQVMSIESVWILSKLINHYTYWENQGRLQPDGSFYKSKEEICLELNVGRKPVDSSQKELQELGVLVAKRSTIPGTLNWTYLWLIDFNRLEELIIIATKKFNDIRTDQKEQSGLTKRSSYQDPIQIRLRENFDAAERTTSSSPDEPRSQTAPEILNQSMPPDDTQKLAKEPQGRIPDAAAIGNKGSTPSIDEIRLDWESRNCIAAASPDFSQRLVLLQELMATYKAHGYKLEDVDTRNNRTRILEHFYKRIKSKKAKADTEKFSLEDWNAAIGFLVEGTVAVSRPPTAPAAVHVGMQQVPEETGEKLTEEEIEEMLSNE
jgi:hypothetical protein